MSDVCPNPDFAPDHPLPDTVETPAIPDPIQIFQVTGIIPVRKLVDDYIMWSLSICKGDKEETAKRLGISQKTVYNRINAN